MQSLPFLGLGISGTGSPKKVLKKIQELYPIMPTNRVILRLLIEIDLHEDVDEAREMYEVAISKLSSKSELGKLISISVLIGNYYALDLICRRFLLIDRSSNFFQVLKMTINSNLNKYAKSYLAKKWKQKLELGILKALSCYQNNIPEEGFNKYQYDKILHQLNVSGLQKVGDPTLKLADFEIEIIELFQKNKFKEVVILCSKCLKTYKELSADTLEISLQSAIKLESNAAIKFYEALAKKQVRRAVYYNLLIEPFFLIKNKGLKKSNHKGLVSAIWTLPVNMENPVNRIAQRVTFPEPKL